jgi:hypothetical protein
LRNIFSLPDFDGNGFDAERAGCSLYPAHLHHAVGITDIGQDRQSAETGDYLAQKFDALASNIGLLDRQAGDVATRSRQIGNEPDTDCVSYGCEHDWNDQRRLLCRDYRPGRVRDDDIDLEPDELG